MKRRIKIIYLVTAVVLVFAIPEAIMHGEDGNLLVRSVMMLILTGIFWLIWHFLSRL